MSDDATTKRTSVKEDATSVIPAPNSVRPSRTPRPLSPFKRKYLSPKQLLTAVRGDLQPTYPLRFKDPIAMRADIDAYFAAQDAKGKPYTLTGMALALNTNRSVLLKYESGKYDIYLPEGYAHDSFSDVLAYARARVEEFAEEKMYTHTAGSVFALVNYTRDSDAPFRNAMHQEISGSGGGPIKIQVTAAMIGVL